MKKLMAVIIVSLLAVPLSAGTNLNTGSPSLIRSRTILSINDWMLHPTDGTGCGGADCCINSKATDQQCSDLSKLIDRNAAAWADMVESWYTQPEATNWICNQEVPAGLRQPITWCQAWPNTQSVFDQDVAIALSEIAAARIEISP